jgi:4-amino-4-deoxy-L-arabinose transferase-like glycosyltransferase
MLPGSRFVVYSHYIYMFMSIHFSKRLWVVAILSLIVFTSNIWGTSIYILDESKNAGCAMEMYQNDDWIVPTFNGELRTDKPVLHYYFMKTAYWLFGVNSFAARIGSALMGVLTVLTVFLFTRRIVHERAAFFAALILVSSIQMAIQFHLAVPDPYLLFLLTLAWLSFYYGWSTQRRRFLYLFYVSAGLAFLTKGPVAVVFSALIVFVFLIVRGRLNWQQIRALRLPEGIALFCVIALPWYYLVWRDTQGEWIDQFFFKHNVGRFTKTMEGHGGFPLASFVILLGGLIPFSFFLPQVLRRLWHARADNAYLVFCAVAMITVVMFFAFSRTILPTYIEPALPFAAIVTGVFFGRMKNYVPDTSKLWISALVYLIIALLLPVVGFIALAQDPSLADLAWMSIAFIILPAGAVVGYLFLRRLNYSAMVLAYVSSLVVFLLAFFYVLFPIIDSRNPVRKSITLLKDPAKPIVYYKDFNPAYIFALRQTIPSVKSVEDIEKLKATSPGFYLITEKDHLLELEPCHLIKRFEGIDLFEGSTTVVLEYR